MTGKYFFFYIKKNRKKCDYGLVVGAISETYKAKTCGTVSPGKKKKENDKECHWPIKALFWSMTSKIKKKKIINIVLPNRNQNMQRYNQSV